MSTHRVVSTGSRLSSERLARLITEVCDDMQIDAETRHNLVTRAVVVMQRDRLALTAQVRP